MKVTRDGHKYELDHLDDPGAVTEFRFVNREKGSEQSGPTTQEVIRMLIDRTWYCNDCLPWSGNKLIVDHLRMALMLHEVRHMIRAVEKGELKPELMHIRADGHFELVWSGQKPSSYARMPATGTETGSLNPGVCSHQQPDISDLPCGERPDDTRPSGREIVEEALLNINRVPPRRGMR